MVAQVDIRLPVSQRIRTHPIERDHDLNVAAAIAERREAQLAAVAVQDDPAGYSYLLAGGVVSLQVPVRATNLVDRVRARISHQIWVDTRGAHPLSLGQPHLHLLGCLGRAAAQVLVALIVGHLPEATRA